MEYNEIISLINEKLMPGSNITASEHKDVEFALLDFARDQWLPGDIKEIDCTYEYIGLNFDSNGIGIGKRLGWAICNGYNGLTKNRAGRVPVGYDSSRTTFESGLINGIGATGGAEKHTLGVTEIPPHSHLMKQGTQQPTTLPANTPIYTSGDDFTTATYSSDVTKLPSTNVTGGLSSTSTNNPTVSNPTLGSTVSHNNMQPYIVTLFIQKL